MNREDRQNEGKAGHTDWEDELTCRQGGQTDGEGRHRYWKAGHRVGEGRKIDWEGRRALRPERWTN